jgi:hypothetical protein
MLIALGIIMSIGGIIAMVGGTTGMLSIPEFDAYGWPLFGAIAGGFCIWIIGVLIGRKHRWDKKTAKDILYYKIYVVVGLIGHLATSFGNDVQLWENPSLTLNQLFIYLLFGCLGVGIGYLTRMQKEESND